MECPALLVVTNNSLVSDWIEQKFAEHCKAIYIDGSIRDVAIYARNKIMLGIRLAADPVAGRRERPTPYLTILLDTKTDNRKQDIPFQVLQVERFIGWYYLWEEKLSSMQQEVKNDFQYIDYSLSVSVLQSVEHT